MNDPLLPVTPQARPVAIKDNHISKKERQTGPTSF